MQLGRHYAPQGRPLKFDLAPTNDAKASKDRADSIRLMGLPPTYAYVLIPPAEPDRIGLGVSPQIRIVTSKPVVVADTGETTAWESQVCTQKCRV